MCTTKYWYVHKKNVVILEYTTPLIQKGDPIYYTSDVVAMSFKTTNEQKAIEWMKADLPRTTK